MEPYRIDLRAVTLLAQCEVWVIPRGCKSHPLAVAFYVPAHLADEATRLLRLFDVRAPSPGKPRLRVEAGGKEA